MNLEDFVAEFAAPVLGMVKVSCAGCKEDFWVYPIHKGPFFCKPQCACDWMDMQATQKLLGEGGKE